MFEWHTSFSWSTWWWTSSPFALTTHMIAWTIHPSWTPRISFAWLVASISATVVSDSVKPKGEFALFVGISATICGATLSTATSSSTSATTCPWTSRITICPTSTNYITIWINFRGTPSSLRIGCCAFWVWISLVIEWKVASVPILCFTGWKYLEKLLK